MSSEIAWLARTCWDNGVPFPQSNDVPNGSRRASRTEVHDAVRAVKMLDSTSVDLSDAGPLQLQALATSLAHNTKLTSLELGARRSLAPEQQLVLCSALQANTTITALGFRELRRPRHGGGFGATAVGCGGRGCAEETEPLRSIRALLARNQLLGGPLARVSVPAAVCEGGCACEEAVVACDCSVGGDLGVRYDARGQGVGELAHALLQRRRWFAAPRSLPPSLVSLDLSGHSLSDDGAATLAECLSSSSSSSSGGGGGGGGGASAFAAAPLLSQLRLRGCGIGDVGCAAIAHGLAGVVGSSIAAAGAALPNHDGPGSGGEQDGTTTTAAGLRELDLSGNEIGDSGAAALARVVAPIAAGGATGGGDAIAAPSLRTLALGRNRIGAAGTEALLAAADSRSKERMVWRGRGCATWLPPALFVRLEEQVVRHGGEGAAAAAAAAGEVFVRTGAVGGSTTLTTCVNLCLSSAAARTPV